MGETPPPACMNVYVRALSASLGSQSPAFSCRPYGIRHGCEPSSPVRAHVPQATLPMLFSCSLLVLIGLLFLEHVLLLLNGLTSKQVRT